MKLDKLFDVNIITGIVLGTLIGLHYPTLGDYKVFLAIAAVVMSLKVVGVLK